MFDVGFSEICLVGLVALLVIGPEKLPQVARFVGFWSGKIKRTVSTVQQEFKENLYAEEVRQLLQQQADIQAQLNQDSLGLQNLLAEDLQQVQADLVKTLTEQKAEPSSPPVTVSPVPVSTPPPDLKQRPKSKKKHRHGKR